MKPQVARAMIPLATVLFALGGIVLGVGIGRQWASRTGEQAGRGRGQISTSEHTRNTGPGAGASGAWGMPGGAWGTPGPSSSGFGAPPGWGMAPQTAPSAGGAPPGMPAPGGPPQGLPNFGGAPQASPPPSGAPQAMPSFGGAPPFGFGSFPWMTGPPTAAPGAPTNQTRAQAPGGTRWSAQSAARTAQQGDRSRAGADARGGLTNAAAPAAGGWPAWTGGMWPPAASGASMAPAPNPWVTSTPWASRPPQGSGQALAPPMWHGSPAGTSFPSSWPTTLGQMQATAMPPDPAYKALLRISEQLDQLQSATEDLELAALAVREKNQDQVREILHRGASKLGKVTRAWREVTAEYQAARRLAANSPSPWAVGGPGPSFPAASSWSWSLSSAGPPEAPSPLSGVSEVRSNPGFASFEVLAPIPVPEIEPTGQRERAILEQTVRTRLRLIQQPFLQLAAQGLEMGEVEQQVRSCRQAVNSGALRDAVVSFNTAVEMIRWVLASMAGSGPGGWGPPEVSTGWPDPH